MNGNSLPLKMYLSIFQRRLDKYWRYHDLKYTVSGDVNCSPIANPWTNEIDASKKKGAADDLANYYGGQTLKSLTAALLITRNHRQIGANGV